jgi:antitoxin component YwqK of YwqJK toxin-antitoxin module
MKSILLLFLLPFMTYAQEVSFDGVELKNGITFLSGTDIRFTGKTVGFYPNGNKCIEIEYRNGIESGTNRTWYNDGTISNETDIDSGKIHGKWIDYYPGGTRQNEITYENDYMNGPCTRWYQNGQSLP